MLHAMLPCHLQLAHLSALLFCCSSRHALRQELTQLALSTNPQCRATCSPSCAVRAWLRSWLGQSGALWWRCVRVRSAVPNSTYLLR